MPKPDGSAQGVPSGVGVPVLEAITCCVHPTMNAFQRSWMAFPHLFPLNNRRCDARKSFRVPPGRRPLGAGYCHEGRDDLH